MFVSISKNNNSISTFLVFTIILGTNIACSFWEARKALTTEESFPLAEIIISTSAILVISILLTFFLQKLKFTGIGDGIVGVVFLTFMLGFKDSYLYFKELLALLVILIVNVRFISLYNKPKSFFQEFEIGSLLGLLVLICPSFFVFVFMILIGFTLVVSFSWRDFVIPLLGMFWVFLLKIIYLFWEDDLLLDNFIRIFISLPKFSLELDLFVTLLIFVFIFELVIILKLISALDNRGIKERVNYWIWIWTGFFLFISLLFFQKEFNKLMFIQFIGLPCSVFSIEYFKVKKPFKVGWKQELIFFCFLISQFAIRIYT